MKVATLFGTRPEIIRLSRVIDRLDRLCDQLLVHTGQNYDPNLSDIFFEELGVRQPDEHWGVRGGSFGEQIAEIIRHSTEFFQREKPDRILILGDTNSGLAALIAARMRIPVYHMEAGTRCYDDRVPEETNRRVIDHCSEVLLPYTHRSKENLLREGIDRTRIFVTGNPIWEVIRHYESQISASDVLLRFSLTPSRYFVVTLHRAENVDDPDRLSKILAGLDLVAESYRQPVVVSLHPRTADKIAKNGLAPKSSLVHFMTPVGFFDFVHLEQHAACVMTDSGTVQEEATLLNVPSVILRDVTERAECLEAGSGILSGADPASILEATQAVIMSGPGWNSPAEYVQENVSSV
ncbi:MAG TPA: UDP-N-acetylglucosamine 2-epimerase (non-hydrolyzing), partial [Fimbriimonadaceae bacterium]|nr:UDP-N-acetylglucosamine 2-epimerase (non-hydrolyzing) [Fimbriimonadaceae bacterium]